MQRLLLWNHKNLFIGTTLILLLALALAGCSLPGSGGSSNNGGSTPTTSTGGNTPTATTGSTTPTATVSGTPQIKLGAQPCPSAVSAPSHWDPIIGTQSGVTKVESVTCGTLIGVPKLQALVTVRYDGTGAVLDVYVYNNITDPSPQQLFKLQGLYKGSARISNYNTVTTGEVDQGSSINKDQPNAGLTQDLFREFKWSDGAGTLVPVGFPGLFPDLTRYQAEDDQQQVNQGHQTWKLDAGQTANALAVQLLKWSTSAQTSVVSGGGANDTDAVVTVKSTSVTPGNIKVTLSRLEGNTNGGIWEVISVTSDVFSISAPATLDHLTSPASVNGSGNAFEGVVGKVTVLDHLYNDIGHAQAQGATGNGSTTYTTSVSYTSSFKGGLQEGVVALYSMSNADGSIIAAVMVKVLIS